MKKYEAKSITYSSTITYPAVSAAVYTVPASRIAKITYIYMESSGFVLKINNSDEDATGKLPITNLTNIHLLGIYLSAGDYLKIQRSTAGTASPNLYISVIEEYEE